MLLTKLSEERRECVLLCQGRMFCSCGDQFDDVRELENHFVRHDRQTNGIRLNMRDVQKELVELSQRLSEKQTRLESFSQESMPSLVRLTVPKSSVFVLLGEPELNVAPLSRVKCCECGQICSSFSDLQRHFQELHPCRWQPAENNFNIVTQPVIVKDKDLKYEYFCPIPACKYHVLNPKLKPIASLKLLKQHYSKVHSQRAQVCDGCGKSFVNSDELQRHWNGCCQSFQCSFCTVSYTSFETLQTHSRRKHNIAIGKRNRQIKKADDCNLAQRRIVVPIMNERGPMKIAPRPSYLHLNAALALSELSSKKFAQKVDRGIQKDFDHQGLKSTVHPTWEEGVKRSAETQTAVSPPKKTRLQRLIDPLQVILPTEEQQTQTPTRRDFDEIAFSDMALGLRDRPVWAASSTQTSPRVPDTSTSLIKDCLLPSDGVSLPPVSGNSNHTASISTSTVGETSFHRPPKLADIEQFSTETQTDFVSQGVGVSTDWDLSFEQFDAGTQFDLDDILCSNYTQTVMGTELNLAESPSSCHVADMINAVHSIETQTISDQVNKAQSSMETQTVLEEFI